MEIEIARAALIDLDGSFFVQLITFLLLWGILTPLVFKPYLKAKKVQEDLTEGRKKDAREIEVKAEEMKQEYMENLKKARAKGQAERARLREEGMRARDEILQREQQQLQAKVQKDMEVLKAQEAQLKAQEEQIARELAGVMQAKIMEVER